MKQASRFAVNKGWKILLADMGINVNDVLRLANLPEDLFLRQDASISVSEYCQLWRGMEQLAGVEQLPLMIGQAISAEVFDPPIFASFCSPNLITAFDRLQHYKRLIGPMYLALENTEDFFGATIECYGREEELPLSLSLSELVFFTQLARLATRHRVVPIWVSTPNLPDNLEAYEAFFGTELRQGNHTEIRFTLADAQRPFLTENANLWSFFEGDLNKRLSDLDSQATTAERLKSLLLEMLPSGLTAMEPAAARLAMSKRTLQRKLTAEGTSFQEILQQTRVDLAQHYLSESELSQGEISFLLGFQDTNSFIRAYSSWTGQPPGQFRQAMSG